MKRARSILNVLGIVFLVLQALGYIGLMNTPSPDVSGVNALAYYTGLNFLAIFALLLFLVSWYLKKRMNKVERARLVESIGQTDN